MKELILMRHGDARPSSGMGDHGRALSPLGLRQAQAVGAFLTRAARAPERTLCSSALRTATTAEQVRAAAGLADDTPHRVTDALYNATPTTALEEIRATAEACSRLLVVGHQPTLGMLAAQLSGGGRVNVGTATAIALGFPIDSWSALRPGDGWILWVVEPSLLMDPV